MPTETSLPVRFTHPQRKLIAELLPELAERLKLDETYQRSIAFTLDEVKRIQSTAEAAMRETSDKTKRHSLSHIEYKAAAATENPHGGLPAGERLYQFKVTLLGLQPPVWRRIQVKNCSLDKLHEHIQTAMGWTNSHLHQFEIEEQCYGDPELLEDEFESIDSTRTKIKDIVPRDGKRFRFQYEYDFGDGWEHEVLFEGCLRAEQGKRYPLCVEGQRACPPEDVGGVWGYAEFLEALADPNHEQHDEYLEWAGPFDPEAFDAGKATKAMRRGLPDWRRFR
jgi:hypothetical protein